MNAENSELLRAATDRDFICFRLSLDARRFGLATRGGFGLQRLRGRNSAGGKRLRERAVDGNRRQDVDGDLNFMNFVIL